MKKFTKFVIFKNRKKYFFKTKASATLIALDEMVNIMPNNTWLLAQLGEGYAMVRMPNESIQAFEKLRQVDPFRLDNMSTLRIAQNFT